MIAPSLLLLLPLIAQDDDSSRLDDLELKLDALVETVENQSLVEVFTPLGDGSHGLGPAASKVYDATQGTLSVGGYGEAKYRAPEGEPNDFDLHRSVLYFGYKFDDEFVFNSEIELEHSDEVSVEFAYVDYLHSDAANFRGGLFLVPMGLINAYHEPTAFLGAERPLTERYILPSTWSEGGAMVYGEVGGFDYRAAIVTGFDGSGFGGTSGLRGGRQGGNRSLAEDLALVLSVDYTDTPGLVLGGSIYGGDAGQKQGGGSMQTTIYEAHVDYKEGPWWARAVLSGATVDDRTAGELDLSGWYAEVGYDLLASDPEQSFYPFVRYEEIDTDIATGGVEDSAFTLGAFYQPIDHLVLKADVTDYDKDTHADRVLLTLGWIF